MFRCIGWARPHSVQALSGSYPVMHVTDGVPGSCHRFGKQDHGKHAENGEIGGGNTLRSRSRQPGGVE